jgi:hypothetical protein
MHNWRGRAGWWLKVVLDSWTLHHMPLLSTEGHTATTDLGNKWIMKGQSDMGVSI